MSEHTSRLQGVIILALGVVIVILLKERGEN